MGTELGDGEGLRLRERGAEVRRGVPEQRRVEVVEEHAVRVEVRPGGDVDEDLKACFTWLSR